LRVERESRFERYCKRTRLEILLFLQKVLLGG